MRKILLLIVIVSLTVSLWPAESLPYVKLKYLATTQIPEDVLIPELGSVVVDTNGNVFAFAGKINGSECFVIKWDKDLKFIKKFVRHGNGPGEVTMNASGPDDRLSVDPFTNDIIVKDVNPARILFFDNDGNYKTEFVPIKKSNELMYLYKIIYMGKGNFIGFKFLTNTWTTDCLLFSVDPVKIKPLYHFNDKEIRHPAGNSQISSLFYGSYSRIDSDAGKFVIANNQVYKFLVFNAYGEKILEVADDSKKITSFSSKEIDFFKKEYFEIDSPENQAYRSTNNKIIELIKDNKNPIRCIRIGGDHIYVFLVHDDITIKEQIPTVIYDMKGKIIKKVLFTKVPIKIWKNYAYYIELNEDDEPFIKKYEILD